MSFENLKICAQRLLSFVNCNTNTRTLYFILEKKILYITEMAGMKRPGESAVNAGPRKRSNGEIDEQLIEEAEAFDMETQENEEEHGLMGDVDVIDDLVDDEAALAVDEAELGEAGKNWMRPAPPPLNPSSEALIFQQFEVDYVTGQPDKRFYSTDLVEVPVVRMYGVNEHGNSVCAFVHGFEPYFYAEAPTQSFSPDDCASLVEAINFAMSGRDRSKNPRSCLRVEVIQRQTILYYQPQKTRAFLKIYMAGPQLVAPCRSRVTKFLLVCLLLYYPVWKV